MSFTKNFISSKSNISIRTIRIPKFKCDFEKFHMFTADIIITYLAKVKRMEEFKNRIYIN